MHSSLHFLTRIPLVAEAKVIGVSVDYRRAPEHPLPAAYDDSWTALKWVASHVNGDGPEEWLNSHADFSKVFFYGRDFAEEAAGSAQWEDEQIEYIKEKGSEEGRQEDLKKGKAAAQNALDEAAFLLDLASIQGTWHGVLELVAEIRGHPYLSSFLVVTRMLNILFLANQLI
ncbi:hypothetical protein D5086_011415 [Populus alba]|uniref:Uncharacterized protein n=1 Tax=Populus alba TaxID=43335 RepID=A0ACC4CCY2_POPAL